MTRKTDYALLALSHMARHGSRCISARDLSSTLGVSSRVLTNVLNRLTHCDLVTSTRGVRGGFSLAMEAATISLAAVIEAVEGPLALTKCCEPQALDDDAAVCDCDMEGDCLIQEPVRKLHNGLRRFLAQVSIGDLAWNTVPLVVEQGGYVDPGSPTVGRCSLETVHEKDTVCL